MGELSTRLLALISDPQTTFGSLSFGWRDFFDVLVVTFLVYAVLRLIQEARLTLVVLGLGGITSVYLASKIFDFPLTRFILQPIFGAIIVLVAVIFQKEIRRFLNFLLRVGIKAPVPRAGAIDIIAKVAFELTKKKTGALMVIQGKEPISYLMEGGVDLRGEVSEALLLSIFDPSSPGHDGAIIFDGNRIKKFAVHLPLAESAEKLKGFGLRHRAAAGIAERSDSIAIVVSEEKSVVSVAEGGEINRIFSEEELKTKLLKFCEQKFQRKPWAHLVSFKKHPAMFTSAAFIAFSIWFVLAPRLNVVQQSFSILPTFVNTPVEFTVIDVGPREIEITIKGRSADISTLNVQDAQAMVDLTGIKTSGWHNAKITKEDIKLPINVELISFTPESISVRLSKVNE